MVSEKFRHQLRQEAEKWQNEGLIDATLFEQLGDRYQFNQLDRASRNRFIAVLIGLGSILLGLAVITFVAANWQVWGREVKVFLLMSLFVVVNFGGFYLWRGSPDGWTSRLGEGFLLLGGLVLGANLGLMSQMFHLTGPLFELFLVWGLAVLVMSYCLRLTSLGILAQILLISGYWSGTFWSPIEQFSLWYFVSQHFPLLAAFGIVPLAYWCRSPWLFLTSTLLVIVSFETNLVRLFDLFFQNNSSIAGWLAITGCCLMPALLWAYRRPLWENQPTEQGLFDRLSRNLAVVFLGITFYVFSFKTFWIYPSITDRSLAEISISDLLMLLDILPFLALTLLAWWRLGYRPRTWWQIDRSSTTILVILGIMALILWWHLNIEFLGVIAIFGFNALLFVLAIGSIREALGTGKRIGFWFGILLMVNQLLSRMLEYDTELLFKALVLFFCGLCVIAAGLWFERYLRTLNPSQS